MKYKHNWLGEEATEEEIIKGCGVDLKGKKPELTLGKYDQVYIIYHSNEGGGTGVLETEYKKETK